MSDATKCTATHPVLGVGCYRNDGHVGDHRAFDVARNVPILWSQAEARLAAALSEVETLRARVAALEAAISTINTRLPRPRPNGIAHMMDDALSGGTAALEAHVAAAVEQALAAERERVRGAVEAVQRYDGKILDAVPMTASPDGRWISRADVLAALDAKGG